MTRAPHELPPEEVAHLAQILLSAGQWLTAASIMDMIPGLSERRLRDLASGSRGKIISGQRGYQHIHHATEEEIHHAQAWLRSQADKMRERADEIAAAKLLTAGENAKTMDPRVINFVEGNVAAG